MGLKYCGARHTDDGDRVVGLEIVEEFLGEFRGEPIKCLIFGYNLTSYYLISITNEYNCMDEAMGLASPSARM